MKVTEVLNFQLEDTYKFRKDYHTYKDMSAWLLINSIDHKFLWNDPGIYLPSKIILDVEDMVAFKLRFLL